MIDPGLHLDVPFERYLQLPRYSQTILKNGLKSMAHLRAVFLRQTAMIPTDDMVLGSALHVAFLEPHLVASRLVVWDGPRRAGKEWETFKSFHQAQGKIILTVNQQAHLTGMMQSLRAHPEVKRWMDKVPPSNLELTAIGEVEGLPMKGRCDALPEGSNVILDVKKTTSCDARDFLRSVRDYGLDLQGAIYRELFSRERMILFAVEDEAPYDVVPFELSPARLRSGLAQAKEIIEKVKECEATGIWPGRSSGIVQLDLAEWEGTSTVNFGD